MRRLLQWLSGSERLPTIESITDLRLDTRFPLWVTLLLGIGGVALAIYLYRREKRLTRGKRIVLTTCRSIFFILLLLMLGRPELVIKGVSRPTGVVPIVTDQTDSMRISDVNNAPRLDAARRLAQAMAGQAEEVKQLEQTHYLFGEAHAAWTPIGAAEITTSGRQTSIVKLSRGALNQHRGDALAGVLILTDGAHNTGEPLLAMLRDFKRRGTPVYAVPIGQTEPRDVSLEHIFGDDVVFVEEKARFFVGVQQNGYAGRTAPAKARFANRPISVEDVVFTGSRDSSFPVEFKPDQTGVYELEVATTPFPDEMSTENNIVRRKIRVIKDKLRLLIIFSTPSWEYRYLTGGFDRDRRINQKIYLQSIDPRMQRRQPSRYLARLPVKEEDLFNNYDLVIIGNVDAHTLPAKFQQLLVQFITEEGGGLAISSDGINMPYSTIGTPLAKLLPVRLTRKAGRASFRQEMTVPFKTPWFLAVADEGVTNPLVMFDADQKRNNTIWQSFPPMYEECPPATLKPSGLPLLWATTGRSRRQKVPAVVYHNSGKGLVLYLGFDSSWRWRKEYGDRYFRDFWGKAAQFLGLPHLLQKSAQSELRLNLVEANLGDPVTVSAAVRNRDFTPYLGESVDVTVRAGDTRNTLTLPAMPNRPGFYRSVFYPEAVGELNLSLAPEFNAEPKVLFVRKINREFQNSGVHLELLHEVADATGGAVFPVEDPAILNDKAALATFSRSVLERIAAKRPTVDVRERLPLWDTLGMLLFALIVLCVEYFFRKRWYLD